MNDFIRIATSPMFIGMICIALGTVLNLIAIKANGGYMPVFPDLTWSTGYIDPNLFNDGLHIMGNAHTKLIPLSDFIDVGYSVLSIGDIFNRLYAFIILYFSIKISNKILK